MDLQRVQETHIFQREERKAALILSRTVKLGREMLEAGETDADKIVEDMKKNIETEPLAKIDYVKAVDGLTMQQVKKVTEANVSSYGSLHWKDKINRQYHMGLSQAMHLQIIFSDESLLSNMKKIICRYYGAAVHDKMRSILEWGMAKKNAGIRRSRP